MPRRSHKGARLQQRKQPLPSAVYSSGCCAAPGPGPCCSGAKRTAVSGMGRWCSAAASASSNSLPKFPTVGMFLKKYSRIHLSGCGRTRHTESSPPWSTTASKHRGAKKSKPATTCGRRVKACSFLRVFKSYKHTCMSVPPVARSISSGEQATHVAPSRWWRKSALSWCRRGPSSVCTLTLPSHDAEMNRFVPLHTARHEISAAWRSKLVSNCPLSTACAATVPDASPK
mmetsp:Transcript_16482/g.49213  ORF Transcript_16482/g.49213 Transcript_16482/m.49213 type:complete len:229 (-) Transcript_16482:1162-1848(-)